MSKTAALGLLLLAVASGATAATVSAPAAEAPPADAPGGWLDGIFNTGQGMTPPGAEAAGNRAAFLAMLRVSEGTAGPDGYRTFYGGTLFDSYAAHPNVKHTAAGITSTAAGAYQFIIGTWTMCQRALNLADFSPGCQDEAAIYLLKQCGALPLIDAGDFAGAVAKAARTWASLPGAGYGQHENSLARLAGVYQQAGGAMA